MNKNQKYIFWGSLIVLHSGFFLWNLWQTPMLKDSVEYLNSASNWDLHDSFYCFDWAAATDFRGFTKRPPIYPFFLFLTGATKGLVWLSLLFQNLLSLLNMALSMIIFRKAGCVPNNNKKRFLLFLLVAIISVSQAIYANLIMSEILFQSIVLLFILQCVLVLKFDNLINWIWAAVLVTAAMFTKPVFLFWIFLLPVFWIFIQIKNRAFYVKQFFGLIPVLTPIMIFHLYAKHNQTVTGLYHFSSISNINLLHYNTRYTLMSAYGQEKADSVLDPLMMIPGTKASFISHSKHTKERCIEIILNNKFSYSKIHVLGMIRMLLDPGRFDLIQFFKHDKNEQKGLMEHSVAKDSSAVAFIRNQSPWLLILLLIIFLFNLVKLVFVTRFLFSKNVALNFRVVIFVMLFYFIALTGPLGASRFLVPVMPIFIGCLLFLPKKNVTAKT